MWQRTLAVLVVIGLQTGWTQERFQTEEVASKFLNGQRTVRIYLPPSYASAAERHYPVLYVHDGQNVFSTAGTNVAFGWGSWALDQTVDALSQAGKMQEVIIVAVDNHGAARYAEYCATHHAPEATNLTPYENYTAFLMQELKPKIDAQFRTKPEAIHTGVLGSSMGGICSLALAWEHPEVFGRAASMSGAFMVEHTNFLNQVLHPYTGKPKSTRIYLDSGAVDFTGGDDGRSLTEAVAAELRRIGWGKELLLYIDAKPLTQPELEKVGLRHDKWAEAETSQHNEFYWRLRAERPLIFLFPP
jgi:predicted alpha/beta superfamily hydrolase